MAHIRTALFGCEVEIFQASIEGSWRATIVGALEDLGVEYYKVESIDGLQFLVPVAEIVNLQLVSQRQTSKGLKRKKKATVLRLVSE